MLGRRSGAKKVSRPRVWPVTLMLKTMVLQGLNGPCQKFTPNRADADSEQDAGGNSGREIAWKISMVGKPPKVKSAFLCAQRVSQPTT